MDIEKTDITSRVSITPQQMEELIGFLEQNPALAKGKTKPQSLSQRLWVQCAKKLNSYKGAKKNGKQWAKSWTDIKYRVRRRAMELQAAKSDGKPLPKHIPPLSHMEERIISVIGKDSIEHVVVKCDGLWEADLQQNPDIFQSSTGSTETLISPVVFQSTSSRSDSESHVEDKPSTRRATRESKTVQKRKLAPEEAPDYQTSHSYRKVQVNTDRDAKSDSNSDGDLSASEFIEMEKRKIQSTERLTDAVCDIRDQMTRLIEIFTEIKDAVIGNRNF